MMLQCDLLPRRNGGTDYEYDYACATRFLYSAGLSYGMVVSLHIPFFRDLNESVVSTSPDPSQDSLVGCRVRGRIWEVRGVR